MCWLPKWWEFASRHAWRDIVAGLRKVELGRLLICFFLSIRFNLRTTSAPEQHREHLSKRPI